MKRLFTASIVWLAVISLVLPLAAGTAKAQQKKSKLPDYSLTLRKDVPVKFTWKVDDIYANDDAWKKDKKLIKSKIKKLEGMLKDWTSSPKKMIAFLKLRDDISMIFTKLAHYPSLQGDMDLSNTKFQKMAGQMEEIHVSLNSLQSGLNTDILNLGIAKFESYLKSEPGLKPYSLFINNVLRSKDHVLPSDQARVYSLSGLFSGGFSKAFGFLNNMELPAPVITLSDGKKVTLTYTNFARSRSAKNPGDRTKIAKVFWANQKKFENTFAALLDSQMKQHLYYARTHNYKDCLTAKLDQNNIDTKVYTKLIEQVRANLSPLHRYIKLKQKLLKLKKFRYEDIYASSVKSIDKVYTIPESRKILMDMMKVLGKEYTDGLTLAFNNRWIDWYSNKNKQSGYYSSSVYNVHPFVKMNYDGSYTSLAYLVHELGHALHSHLAEKTQHFANTDYPSFLAEIASTFNENILVDYLLKHETDDLFKLFILDEYMSGVKGTVYRQTQFAEFELAMHRHVESGQTLTPDWLNKKYLELARYYYGHDKGVTEVDEYIQNEWSAIPHFYYNYYVYTYSTGFISSAALADMVQKGKTAERDRYLDFLKSGGSQYPLDILKTAGVDITTDKPYKAAFNRFNRIVTEMEKIVDRLEKKKLL